MRKYIGLLIGTTLLFIMTIGCSTQENTKTKMEYSTYEVEDIKYLSALSSSTPDYFLELSKGKQFILGKNEFSIDVSKTTSQDGQGENYENVTYVEDDIKEGIITMEEDISTLDLSEFNEKISYKILSNKKDTGFRIYYLDNEVWISHFSVFGQNSDAWWADYIFSVTTKN